MTSREVTIHNATGLHARPAAEFVTLAKTFVSQVTLQKVGASRKPVNAKSILLVLAEGCGSGTCVEIAADGPDETEAVDRLIRLIESGFNE